MATARHEITFSGRVQGVGFRYTATRIAERHDVSGWVRNEPDGTVRCVVEGEPDELDRFVSDLQGAMSGNISDTRIGRREATGEFDGFGVRH